MTPGSPDGLGLGASPMQPCRPVLLNPQETCREIGKDYQKKPPEDDIID